MRFTYNNREVDLNGFSEDDWIYSSIVRNGTFYEIDLLKYMRFVLANRQGAILDIGANIGNHSVFFGLFISDRVICFEPNPAVLPVLKKNLQSNQICHQLFELGLGDCEGLAVIELPSLHNRNVGAARLKNASACVSDYKIRVATLDSLLPDVEAFLEGDSVKAIKADVEGMEAAVLRGSLTLLQRYKPDLFLEIAESHQMREVEATLLSFGYRRLVSSAATPVWHFMHLSRLTPLMRLKVFIYKFSQRLLYKLRSLLNKIPMVRI